MAILNKLRNSTWVLMLILVSLVLFVVSDYFSSKSKFGFGSAQSVGEVAGTKISVVEFTGGIISSMDSALGKELQKSLKKIGFEFYFNHKVTGVVAKGNEVIVAADNANGEKVELIGDYCLLSVGRKPYTDNLGLDKEAILSYHPRNAGS